MKFKIIFSSGAVLEFQGTNSQLLDNWFSFLRGQLTDAQRYSGPNGAQLVLDFKQVAGVVMNA
jgi:hypothetical protein